MLFEDPYVYDTKQPIFMLPLKCAVVGAVKKLRNTHVQCGSVRDEKLLCAECAGVAKLAAHKYSAPLCFIWCGYNTCGFDFR